MDLWILMNTILNKEGVHMENINDIEIDEKAVKLMELRIIKKERDNEKTNDKSPSQMVDTVRKIIEEEVDQIC